MNEERKLLYCDDDDDVFPSKRYAEDKRKNIIRSIYVVLVALTTLQFDI